MIRPSSVPPADREAMELAGYGRRKPLGVRPALLIVDVTRRFVGSPGLSRADAIREIRTSCGPAAWEAVGVIAGVQQVARECGVPIIYSKGASLPPGELGAWSEKSARAGEDLMPRNGLNEIVEGVAPQPGELVLEKERPSAFFGTMLASKLVSLSVDTLVVTGCTTSGCVRATVVDAFSFNYPVAVIEDGVFDRFESSHEVSLFDLDAKYANVMPSEDVSAYLRHCGSGPGQTSPDGTS